MRVSAGFVFDSLAHPAIVALVQLRLSESKPVADRVRPLGQIPFRNSVVSSGYAEVYGN